MPPTFHTPEWVHHAVFYQIFPDRFASSSQVPKPDNLEPWDTPPTALGFKGGDLAGVIERLDYLQDLGINAIYFTPVFQSASNHRYHTHDYFKVDPMLGGDGVLKKLLLEAHHRNIKIVLDGVFNHASRGFFQFNHILECGATSPYLDWFDVYEFPMNAYWGKPNYRCWENLAALPEFNYNNPRVVEFIYSVARHWIDFGIDGWRLDVPFCFGDDEFWQGFRQVVKTANPEAYITGEIPEDGSKWLKGDQFDGVMNYLLTYCAWGFFGGEKINQGLVGHWAKHAGPLLTSDTFHFARNVENLLTKYPHPAVLAQLNVLDSHDTARLMSILGGDERRMRLAALFQMTYPGAPCIYYGDEIGMEGGQDPDCRRAFPWDEQRWNSGLRDYYKKLIALRKKHRALTDGSFNVLYDQNGVIAILRQWHEQQIVVVLNRTEATLRLELDIDGLMPEGRAMRDELNNNEVHVSHSKLAQIFAAPMSGSFLA